MTKAMRTKREVRQGTQTAASLRARAGGGPVVKRGERRGMAMMLVLIALSVATVVTAATLTARSMSPYVAENAHDTASARWSSASAANFAVGMLEAGADWESMAGQLASDLSIGDGTATITITNLSGGVPTSDDRDLILTAVSVVDGIESTTQRLVRIAPAGSLEDALDPHLGEFAVYTKNGVSIADNARIAPWSTSPEGRTPVQVRLASSAASAADIQISTDARLTSSVVYFDQDATMSAPDMLPADMSYVTLPLSLPLIVPTAPSTTGLATQSASDLTYNGSGEYSLVGGKYKKVEVGNGTTVHLTDDAGGLYQMSELKVNGGLLVVDGNIELVVTDRMEVQLGELAFKDGASLELYATNEVRVRTKGGWKKDVSGDPTVEDAMYVDPRNFVICVTGAGSLVRLDTGSLLCAEVLCPRGTVQLDSNASLFGQVAAQNLVMNANSKLYYDPALDSRMGFSDLDGPLYDADGQPLAGLQEAISNYNGSLEDFAPTVETAVMDALGLLEELLGGLLGGGGEPESVRTDGGITVSAIPTAALAFESGSMFEGTVAPNADGTAPTPVTLAELGRDPADTSADAGAQASASASTASTMTATSTSSSKSASVTAPLSTKAP
ncbi:MAG: hypothetical protein KDA20_13370 [Phycisphaerales bacterium]|nr:hypothetical protein [Phycisphaerales bacterium]